MRKLLFEPCELVFVDRQTLIRAIGQLVPAVTGLRLKGGGCRVYAKIPVAIRAIAIQVHVALNKQGFAARIGILQLKDRFAVIEVMTGEEEVESIETVAQELDLVLVECFKMGRHARGIQESCQLGQDFWELRIIPGQFLDSQARSGHVCCEGDLDLVAIALIPLKGGWSLAPGCFEFA
ncbi:MAG: hypothetical protein WCC08_00315 [Terrimicrobiaceae bacterium]